MVFGTRDLQYWVLGRSGLAFCSKGVYRGEGVQLQRRRSWAKLSSYRLRLTSSDLKLPCIATRRLGAAAEVAESLGMVDPEIRLTGRKRSYGFLRPHSSCRFPILMPFHASTLCTLDQLTSDCNRAPKDETKLLPAAHVQRL